jgi:hypothetical protein
MDFKSSAIKEVEEVNWWCGVDLEYPGYTTWRLYRCAQRTRVPWSVHPSHTHIHHTHNVPGSSRPSSSHGSVHLSTPLACTVALNHKGQRWPLIFPANGSAVALGNCEGRCGREVNIISICKRGACGILWTYGLVSLTLDARDKLGWVLEMLLWGLEPQEQETNWDLSWNETKDSEYFYVTFSLITKVRCRKK